MAYRVLDAGQRFLNPHRMSIPSPRLLACLLLALLWTWLAAWRPFSAPEPDSAAYFLALSLHTETKGQLGVLSDEGHGFPVESGPDTWTEATEGDQFHATAIRLHSGQICRIELIARLSGPLEIAGARIVDSHGATVTRLDPSLFTAGRNAELAVATNRLRATPATPMPMYSVIVALERPLTVPSGNEPSVAEQLLDVVVFTLLFFLALHFLQRRGEAPALATLRARAGEALAELRAKPTLTLFCVSFAAVIINEHPVVFFGKSLVSSSTHARLLYDTMPTLPEAPVEPKAQTKFADTEATAWQNMPYAVIESRALWKDHEFPLWQRYNSCGVTLLGQGQSMLGDPLHTITLLANGAWWSWDIKFVLAKTLFAFALGLAAWELTRRLSISCLTAASAVWIGFFAYRYNHCAVFSVCYAPLILVPWLRLKRSPSLRAALPWAGMLILADWMEFNSGTAKEAAMLLLFTNVAGFFAVLLAEQPWREKRAKAGLFVWTSVLFILLCAPFWMTFLGCLRQAFTVYDNAPVYQLQPGLFLALFDGLFSQDFAFLEGHINPSVNFLVLTGCLWLLAAWPECRKNRSVLAIGAACLLPLALVFGIVPPPWIQALPFLKNIQHVHNTFGVVLVVLLPLLAAAGLNHCLESSRRLDWRAHWVRMAVFLGLGFCLYLGFTQAGDRPAAIFSRLDPFVSSAFFLPYAFALAAAALLLPWALRWSREKGEVRLAGAICLAVCFFTLHFRHGMYVQTKFDGYVMTPRSGFDLVARSIALDRLKRRIVEPARAAGFIGTFWPGYTGVMDIEGISGPDALINRWYREFYEASKIDRLWKWCLVIHPEALPKEKKIYDFLNLRYYLHDPRAPGQIPLLTLGSRADLDIYESKEAWPRAFFTDSVLEYENTDGLMKSIVEGDGRPFAAIQGKSPFPAGAPFAERKATPATNYKLTNNTTEFSVTAPGPGVVVLSECFEEGNFRVTVNGAPAPYFRVNHTFKGIYVDHAGEYRIRYSYWPSTLTPALWLAALGALLTAATFIVLRRPPPPLPTPATAAPEAAAVAA